MDAAVLATWTGVAVAALAAALATWQAVRAQRCADAADARANEARESAAESLSQLARAQEAMVTGLTRPPWRIERERGNISFNEYLVNNTSEVAWKVRLTALGSPLGEAQEWPVISPGGRQLIQVRQTLGFNGSDIVVHWDSPGMPRMEWHSSLG